jgi:MoaA/NifB/PqqE/SkfB family radical SAM enzyme
MRRWARKLYLAAVPDLRFRKIDESSFIPHRSLEAQRALFAKMVELINVEVHSYCNRTCWFCPNSLIDRRAPAEHMDESIYLRLLGDLRDIRYSGVIGFSGHIEPFAEDVFFERLRQARRLLPRVRLHTSTNGDYLDGEAVERAYSAGLRSLNIQIYLKEERDFSLARAKALAEKKKKRISCVDFRVRRVREDWVDYYGRFKDMKIRMQARDFRKLGVNKAGLSVSPPVTRVSPCLQPFTSVFINHEGSVVPCANVRSDIPEQEHCRLGRVDASDGAVFRVFSGRKVIAWRRRIIGFGPKLPPCGGCNWTPIPDNPLNRRYSRQKEFLANSGQGLADSLQERRST